MKIVCILNRDFREIACVEFHGLHEPLGRVGVEFLPERSAAKIRYGEVSQFLAKDVLGMLEKGMTAGKTGEHSWAAFTQEEFARKISLDEQFQTRFELNREQMAVLNGVPLPELNQLSEALPLGDGKNAKDFCIKTIYDSVSTRWADEQRESLAECPAAKMEMM